MTLGLQCARYEADDTLARYVAGTLPPEQTAPFEDHLLLCERCQASVRAVSGARRHFSEGKRIRRRPAPRWWAVGLAAAAVAGVIGVRAIESVRVRHLGIVTEAPIYLGTPVRGPEQEAAVVFDSAIVAYNRADYADALRRFDRIDSAAGRIVVDFFAGASALMLGRAREAEVRYSAVIASGHSPYYDEALYYRAKAYLQQGRKAAAIADLRAARRLSSPVADQSAALLKELEE